MTSSPPAFRRRRLRPQAWSQGRRCAAALLLLVLLVSGKAAAEESLGRLFYTPEERRHLDHLRSLGAAQPGLAPAPALRLDGVLRHPDGRVTAWINGRPAEAGRVAPGPGPEQARITTAEGKSVPLKVGEALPADGGAPRSLLGDGRAERTRGKAAR